jgi:hypothetical protein
VTLITDQIEEITENGVKTTKMEYDFDTIIYATGFDLIKSMNPYKITGVGEKSLAEDMGDTPAAYNGVVVVSFKLVMNSRLPGLSELLRHLLIPF